MFKDKVELKDFAKMDPEYQDLLKRVLTIQSDYEIGGPHLYADTMLPTAPTKIDQLVVARTAAEEIDHYRKIARLAGDIGLDVSFVLSWGSARCDPIFSVPKIHRTRPLEWRCLHRGRRIGSPKG